MPEKPTPAQRVIDRLTAAVESERLRASLIDDLDEAPFTELEEWAESLTTVAEHVSTVRDAIEAWQNEEDREAKADAKADALAAIEDLVASWQDSPLDLAHLEAWEPEADE